MIRLLGILVGLVFAVAVLWSFGKDAYSAATTPAEVTAEHEFHEHPHEPPRGWTFTGPFGRYDEAQLQRGYQVYQEVCSACHSLRLVAFRDLAELGYSDGQVKNLAASWQVPGVDPNTGEANLRPGLPTDYFPSPYPNDIAARAANNNAVPPDLSLITKARHGGSDYVYSLLTGYSAPPPELLREFPEFSTPEGLHFNRYFPNLNIAMAPPLTADNQVSYAPGNPPATIRQMAKDVTTFLTWTAEPTMIKRKQTGWPVLGFLLFATILAWFSKKQIWAAAKARRDDEG